VQVSGFNVNKHITHFHPFSRWNWVSVHLIFFLQLLWRTTFWDRYAGTRESSTLDWVDSSFFDPLTQWLPMVGDIELPFLPSGSSRPPEPIVIRHTVKTYTPFTRYNRLSSRLYKRFDNRLYRVNKHPTGCQTGLTTGLTNDNRVEWTATVHSTGCQARFDKSVERAAVRSTDCQTGLYNRFDKHGLTTVLNEQLFVQPSCSFNRLSNWAVQPVWQLAVYTIQPVVKPFVKRVWQPVECLCTRYNQLSNPFDNWFDNRLSYIQTFNRLWNRFDNRLYRVNGALVSSCQHLVARYLVSFHTSLTQTF